MQSSCTLLYICITVFDFANIFLNSINVHCLSGKPDDGELHIHNGNASIQTPSLRLLTMALLTRAGVTNQASNMRPFKGLTH